MVPLPPKYNTHVSFRLPLDSTDNTTASSALTALAFRSALSLNLRVTDYYRRKFGLYENPALIPGTFTPGTAGDAIGAAAKDGPPTPTPENAPPEILPKPTPPPN